MLARLGTLRLSLDVILNVLLLVIHFFEPLSVGLHLECQELHALVDDVQTDIERFFELDEVVYLFNLAHLLP